MIVTFERNPFGWVHPYSARRQRCSHRRPHPYLLSDWDSFVRPVSTMDTLSQLFQLADLEQHCNTIPKEEAKQSQKNDKFEVKVDVKEFTPDELNVKMHGNSVIIEGKHEEKDDGKGYVSRQFVRRYHLPDNVKPEMITCNLGADGVLIMSAPLMIEDKKEEAKTIPITVAEKPAVTEKEAEGKKEEEATNRIVKKLGELEDEVIIDPNPAA